MRKVSQDFNKKSPALVLSEGKWAGYLFKPEQKSKLQNFSGLLYLEDNDQPKILKQIVEIKFSNLLKLSLQSNNIESIQYINELFCPKLTELQLGDNKISCIKSLRRASLQNLKILSLRSNKIIEFQPLQQLYSIIRSAFIEWYNDEGYCNDVSWVVKMQTFQFKSLWLESRTRIIQKKVFANIQQKFPLLKLYYNQVKT